MYLLMTVHSVTTMQSIHKVMRGATVYCQEVYVCSGGHNIDVCIYIRPFVTAYFEAGDTPNLSVVVHRVAPDY